MIEPRYFCLNIFLLMIGTLLIRGSFIAMSARLRVTSRLREIFSYFPAAILPAFIGPAVFYHRGHVEWAAGKERLLVLAFSLLICAYTRSTLATIASGLFALYLITQLF